MQPRHPLRETLLADDPSDARAAPATAAGVSAASSPAASSSGVCSSLSRSFSSLVPDVRSRVAFAFAFLCALAVSAYWLQLTIRSKWLFQQQHPTQVVSYDSVDSLPALFGLQFYFQDAALPLRWTHLRRVTPLLMWPSSMQLASPFIRCSNLILASVTYAVGQTPMPSAFCESLASDGSLVLDPASAPAGELDGSSARSLPLSDWPLQFAQSQNGEIEVCFQLDVLLNHTAMLREGLDAAPMFTVASLSSSAMLAVHELVAAGLVASPADPAVTSLLARNDYSIVSFLPFGASSYFQTVTTRTVAVNEQMDYAFDYELVGSIPLAPSRITANWGRLINETADATERTRMQALKDDPSSIYATAMVCTRPRTFIVQEIAFFHLYGWSSFLSDVGGFVSILSLVFVALFPLTVRVTKARDFLPLWLLKRCKKEKSEHDAADVMELHVIDTEPRASV